MNNPDITERRKIDHIEICSTRDVAAKYNFWDDIHLIHEAAPELDYDQIEIGLNLFGKELAAPIIVSGMTGGSTKGEKINGNLAKAVSDLQIGMGVGSQRAALEKSSLKKSYAVLKDFDIPLKIANIGAPQIVMTDRRKGITDLLNEARDMIDADLIAIHLNYLQEAVQPEGEKRAKGLLALIRDLSADFPIIVKETGAGLSPQLLKILSKMKIKGVDVGGSGGTSFSAVEFYRAQERGDEMSARLGRTYWNWGIPAPVSAALASISLLTIATGGIRTGQDVARAITVGASCAGIANRLLIPSLDSFGVVEDELTKIIEELKVAMFLTASRNLKALSEHNPLVTGFTREWLDHLLK